MKAVEFHPGELGYAFSYAQVEQIIGWGIKPFQPNAKSLEEAQEFFDTGEQRLLELNRLVNGKDNGLRFEDNTAKAILTLVNPTLVLAAERRVGTDALRRMTVHISPSDIVGLNQRSDGMFEITRYANLSAAAAACAGFCGAALDPFEDDARIDTRKEFLTKLRDYAHTGKTKAAAKAMMAVGMSASNAASATRAMAEPAAIGMLTVYYCAANRVKQAEPFSVLTNKDAETWVVFPPASLEAPMTLERSSITALAARISVGAMARMAILGKSETADT